MIIAIYGLILLVFWLLALKIEPLRYPDIDPEIVWAWRHKKLSLYRRYAGLLLIWIVLALGNQILYSHSQWRSIGKWSIAFTGCFMAASLIYIAYNTYQNYLWQKKHFVKTQ